MKKRMLLVCGGAMALLFGCASQQTAESPQALIKENADLVENSAENVAKPPPPPPPVTEADKPKSLDNKAMSCKAKGEPVMLENLQIGITIRVGYCAADLKPEGSKIWVPETEAPALGNISVDDPCNITYCPTTPHYDHFGITDGKNTVQIQVKWEDDHPTIFTGG